MQCFTAEESRNPTRRSCMTSDARGARSRTGASPIQKLDRGSDVEHLDIRMADGVSDAGGQFGWDVLGEAVDVFVDVEGGLGGLVPDPDRCENHREEEEIGKMKRQLSL